MSPFGATGPYADYDGNSLTAMAMSTIMYNTGDPDREPLATGGEPGEYIAGVQLWIGILAALENRARTAAASTSMSAMADAVACADEYNAAMYALPGRDPAALLLAPHLRLSERHHGLRRRARRRHPGRGGLPARRCTPDTVSPMALLLEDLGAGQARRCSRRWASA